MFRSRQGILVALGLGLLFFHADVVLAYALKRNPIRIKGTSTDVLPSALSIDFIPSLPAHLPKNWRVTFTNIRRASDEASGAVTNGSNDELAPFTTRYGAVFNKLHDRYTVQSVPGSLAQKAGLPNRAVIVHKVDGLSTFDRATIEQLDYLGPMTISWLESDSIERTATIAEHTQKAVAIAFADAIRINMRLNRDNGATSNLYVVEAAVDDGWREFINVVNLDKTLSRVKAGNRVLSLGTQEDGTATCVAWTDNGVDICILEHDGLSRAELLTFVASMSEIQPTTKPRGAESRDIATYLSDPKNRLWKPAQPNPSIFKPGASDLSPVGNGIVRIFGR